MFMFEAEGGKLEDWIEWANSSLLKKKNKHPRYHVKGVWWDLLFVVKHMGKVG